MNTLDSQLQALAASGEQALWVVDGHIARPSSALELGPGQHATLIYLQTQDPAQEEITARLHLRLHAGARLQCFLLSLQGQDLRNTVEVDLLGKGAHACLYGLTLGSGTQRMAHRLTLNHQVAHTTSSQLFKGILGQQAQAFFDGLIRVQPGAQQIEAYQANHNLLLSSQAKVHTNPQLEIYADDVKCSHGASIGRLDEEALFYLRSRGIDPTEARLLQQMAFVNEVLDPIPWEGLRNQVIQQVEARLRGSLAL